MSIESFTKRFNKGESLRPENTRGFNSNGNKNVGTEMTDLHISLS